MPKSKRPTLGACGEHYVASCLSGMGLMVELTKPATKLVDMRVATKSGKRQVSVHVKAGGTDHNHVGWKRNPKNGRRVWQVGKTAFGHSKNSHWYAFVTVGKWPLRGNAPAPDFYFIPSPIVAKTLRENPKNQPDWFWIYDTHIEKYRGLSGYNLLKRALSAQS